MQNNKLAVLNQQLKLGNVRLNEDKQQQIFDRKIGPKHLLQILKFKNKKIDISKGDQKILDQQKMNNALLDKDNNLESIQKTKLNNISGQLQKQRNILTQFQSKQPQNKKLNKILKKSLQINILNTHSISNKNNSLITDSQALKVPLIQNEKQSNQLNNQLQFLLIQQSDRSIHSDTHQQDYQKIFLRTIQHQKFNLHKQQLSKSQSKKEQFDQISRLINADIKLYFIQNYSLSTLLSAINNQFKYISDVKSSSHINLFKQRLFVWFLNNLNSKMTQALQKSQEITAFCGKSLQQDYYLTYCDNQNKLNLNVLLRCRKLAQDNIQNKPTQFQDQNNRFWCKCLMLLFCFLSKRANQTLRKMLIQRKYEWLLQKVEQLKQGKIAFQQSFWQLSKKKEFIQNKFYRILVRIICNKQLQNDQIQLLYTKQQKLMTYFKLKYADNYHKSRQFQHYQMDLIENLKYYVNLLRMQQSQQILSTTIMLSSYDQLYFNFICAVDSPYSYLQQILLWKVFMENKDLLKYSNYDERNWIRHALNLLIKLIPYHIQENQINSIISIILYTVVLISNQPVCHEDITFYKQFEDTVVKILTLNRVIFQVFITQICQQIRQGTHVSITMIKFIHRAQFKSIIEHKNYVVLIKSFISMYINVQKIQCELQKSSKQSNKKSALYMQSLRLQSFVSKQTRGQHIIQFNENQPLEIFKLKSFVFKEGLIMMNKYIFDSFICDKLVANKQQNDQYFKLHYQIYKQTNEFLNKLSKRIRQCQSYTQKGYIQQFIRILERILKLGQFLIAIIYIKRYIQTQQHKYLNFISNWIAKIHDDKESFKLQIQVLCRSLKVFSVINQQSQIQYLLDFVVKIIKLVKKGNIIQARKISPLATDGNNDKIVKFLKQSLQFIQSHSQIQEQQNVKFYKLQSQRFLKSR